MQNTESHRLNPQVFEESEGRALTATARHPCVSYIIKMLKPVLVERAQKSMVVLEFPRRSADWPFPYHPLLPYTTVKYKATARLREALYCVSITRRSPFPHHLLCALGDKELRPYLLQTAIFTCAPDVPEDGIGDNEDGIALWKYGCYGHMLTNDSLFETPRRQLDDKAGDISWLESLNDVYAIGRQAHYDWHVSGSCASYGIRTFAWFKRLFSLWLRDTLHYVLWGNEDAKE